MSLLSNRRDDVDRLVADLAANSEYFTAPASTRYHCNWSGGLLEHSLDVTENVLALKGVMAPGIPDDSCVVCGLFHDLGKAPLGPGMYERVVPTARQEQYGYVPFPPYRVRKDVNRVYLSVPHTSVLILMNYLSLTDWECQAILIHDGPYAEDNGSYARKETPFSLLLHYADGFAAFAQEGSIKQSVDGHAYESEWPTAGQHWMLNGSPLLANRTDGGRSI